ncbi:hypothetical protein BDP27DRAFT_1368717 [Rhodocollybia butyracea]|uniref:FAD-binding PCMH-type domain-containing protein n=1 Tax=Rhodocollybia butyracea TaxID=206335 RepID=A0A9P5PCI7_9AGAR|nr:hypothetical protein BDP27DRAFT_1368717 [Rhodocollybia butyracea]
MSWFLKLASALFTTTAATSILSTSCKCFPGDRCWPSTAEWDAFNTTVGGRLIATVPLGRPCHDPFFSPDICRSLQGEWQHEEIHYNSSSSVMAPFFANQSCDPFQPQSRSCAFGNYVRFAVNASGSADIQAAIAFARDKNIRFVIRNTGHDYLGRSTGAGSLAVWTHHLKDIEVINWSASDYTGPAVKLGAGVQGFDVLTATKDLGLIVVGGECPSVGLAGGYTQGGGHSAISTNFGLSADNVLSCEVVTASGQLVNASAVENSDLFWAVRGGGGGTYGALVSMTVKAHPDAIFGGATLNFNTTDNSNDTFWAGIQAFHEALADMVDSGTMVIYTFTNTSFQFIPLTAYNKTSAQVEEIMTLYLAALNSLGVQYTVAFTEFNTYFEHYNNYFGPLPDGSIEVGIAQYGGRLIPRTVVANISDTIRSIADQGVTWIGVGTNVEPFGTTETTSVPPAWREALVHAVLTTPWNFTAPWRT